MAHPVIRPAVPGDVGAILKIEAQSFARPNWDAEAFARYPTTVAEWNGEVIGVLVTRETYRGDEVCPAEVEILNLAVAPSWRRQGIASALLENLLRRRAVFFLKVRESNVPAQELYRGFQFVVVGRRAAYYENPVESALVMQMKKC